MPPKITKDIQIGELIMGYPESVEVLFAHGFHCIGCGLSAYETLEQGAAAHGFDEAAIGAIIAEIEEAAKKAKAGPQVRKCEEAGAAQDEKQGKRNPAGEKESVAGPEKRNLTRREQAGAEPKSNPAKKK